MRIVIQTSEPKPKPIPGLALEYSLMADSR